MTEDRLMRIPEVAERLSVSVARAYELAASGELPGVVRIGRSVRIRRDRLDAWLDWIQRAPDDGIALVNGSGCGHGMVGLCGACEAARVAAANVRRKKKSAGTKVATPALVQEAHGGSRDDS